MKITGEGMPHKDPTEKGDLYIKCISAEIVGVSVPALVAFLREALNGVSAK